MIKITWQQDQIKVQGHARDQKVCAAISAILFSGLSALHLQPITYPRGLQVTLTQKPSKPLQMLYTMLTFMAEHYPQEIRITKK